MINLDSTVLIAAFHRLRIQIERGKRRELERNILQKVADPENIEEIPIDLIKLPKGDYKTVDFESRQDIEIEISRVITEYRAQVIEDQNGESNIQANSKSMRSNWC